MYLGALVDKLAAKQPRLHCVAKQAAVLGAAHAEMATPADGHGGDGRIRGGAPLGVGDTFGGSEHGAGARHGWRVEHGGSDLAWK
jgi:hypothetical protein